MKKTIAVIAPMFDPFSDRFNMDYTIRLKETGAQLTLENLYYLSNADFNTDKLPREKAMEYDTIAAAGYYLLSFLRQSGYEAVLVAEQEDFNKAAAAGVSAVCISTTMILEKTSLAAIIRQVRKAMGTVPVIVGGILVWKSYKWCTLMKESRASGMHIDEGKDNNNIIFPCAKPEIDADVFVVSPHGSRILLEVLTELERGTKADFTRIPNLAIPDTNGSFSFTERKDEGADYDKDYIHWEYVDTLPLRIPVRTSIGCPFRCRYCDFCFLYPKIFYRSFESMKSELTTIKNALRNDARSNRMINFTDDNVFITRDRAAGLCRLITDSQTGLPWAGFIRSSSVTPGNIGFIKDSGLTRAWIGVESGDPGQLKRMNKKQNLGELSRGIELLDSNNISVHMTFIVGFPGETEETINKTIEFLNSLSVSMAEYVVYPLVISPMSEISFPDARKKWNIKGLFRSWSHSTMTSEKAIEYSREIFKKVENVPYYYSRENRVFTARFGTETRKKLYRLRHLLTRGLMEGESPESIGRTFSVIAETMEIKTAPPSSEFIHKLLFPGA